MTASREAVRAMSPVFQPEELALLDAIHTSPKDDAPRLAYADWLEKGGASEHAEFIRLQCCEPYLTVWYRDWQRPRLRFCGSDDTDVRERGDRLLALLPTAGRAHFERLTA